MEEDIKFPTSGKILVESCAHFPVLPFPWDFGPTWIMNLLDPGHQHLLLSREIAISCEALAACLISKSAELPFGPQT